MLSRKWRCSWSSTDSRCSNYIWGINNFIAHRGASYMLLMRLLLICSFSEHIKSGKSITQEVVAVVALRKPGQKWPSVGSETHSSDRKAWSGRFRKCCQAGPTPILRTNEVQYKLNSDDNDDLYFPGLCTSPIRMTLCTQSNQTTHNPAAHHWLTSLSVARWSAAGLSPGLLTCLEVHP